jgi:hypothetical protein
MELPEISNTELANLVNKKEIVQELVNQLKKDLGMFGIEMEVSQNDSITYNQLHTALVQKLETLFQTDNSRIYAILYRVDISEKDLESAGLDLPNYNFLEIVANQIIKRELKKVLIRKFYNQQC